MRSIYLMALLATSAPAIATIPTKFDLVCEGTFRSGQKTYENYKFRYVVDVDRGLWCKNEASLTRCPKVKPIIRVDETRYTFVETQPGGLVDFDYVDRQTGASESYDQKYGFKGSGKCVAAEFSGFPEPKL
jgi:hypothetical protein